MEEQERKRFEEWARPDSVQMRRHPETGEYTERGMNATWAAWQAAVKVEREACAKVAEAAAEKLGDLGRQHRNEGHEHSMDRCYARALQCTQLAADIRTRSNVQISGAGTASAESDGSAAGDSEKG